MIRKFKPSDTEIFTFVWPDGSEGRADPLRLKRRMDQATHGKRDALYDQAIQPLYRQGDDGKYLLPLVELPDFQRLQFEASQAQEKLIAATAHAFEVAAYDPATGEGALEDWLWDTALALDDWLQKKSESTGTPRG